MRGVFSLVSLLIIGVAAAYYFTTVQPVVDNPAQYQKLQSKVSLEVTQMQHDPQADVDAAAASSSAPATNPAPPPQ